MDNIENINNCELKFPRAIPLKDSTSDGSSTFSMYRRTYTNMFSNLKTTQQQINSKKWYGGNNRDASSVIEKQRNKEVGKGTLNLEENNTQPTISFCKGNDQNYVDRRRNYTRSGGATVPAKCRFPKI